MIYGVDFSGAADAGRKIWLSCGRAVGDTLQVEWCRPAEALPGSGRARAVALAALRELIAAAGPALIGLDFPLSLPLTLMPGGWPAWLAGFAEQHPTAEAFRAACYAAAAGRELKRRTDRETATPFAPYNLRLYRQTYYGIRDLIAPLVQRGQAAVLPLEPARPSLPRLIEICPAATLKREGLYRPYKGPGPAQRAARAQLLDALAAMFPLRLPAGLPATLIADREGDALDSLIAACAIFRQRATLADTQLLDPHYQREGYVYT